MGAEETWVVVEGYPRYQVSSKGRVKSFAMRASGKLLRFGAAGTEGAYRTVRLYGDKNESKMRFVHHLVAEAFVGVRPPGHHVNHKDGNKRNNQRENLEYVTRSQNAIHAIKLGIWVPNSKITLQDAVKIRKRLANGEKVSSIAANCGVKRSQIYNIKNGVHWREN